VASAEVAAVPVTMEFMRAALDPDDSGPAGAAVKRAAIDAFFLDREKVVWEWPDASARLIEELR
jgi:hypothetical protein